MALWGQLPGLLQLPQQVQVQVQVQAQAWWSCSCLELLLAPCKMRCLLAAHSLLPLPLLLLLPLLLPLCQLQT